MSQAATAITDASSQAGSSELLSPSRLGFLASCSAHRLLSAALILLAAGIAAIVADKPAGLLLLWAFAAGDLALLTAFVSLASDRRRQRSGREALVVAIVSAVVLLTALALYFFAR